MIDREKVIKNLEFCVKGHFKVELSLAIKILALLKEQERKKGSWDYGTQCSVCKGTIIPSKDRKVRVNFCPWCGADMRDSYE